MNRRSRNPERRSHIHDDGIPKAAFSPQAARSSPQPHHDAGSDKDGDAAPQYPREQGDADDQYQQQRSLMRHIQQQHKRLEQQQQQASAGGSGGGGGSPLDAPVSAEEMHQFKELRARQWLQDMPARVRHFVSTAQSDITMRIFREVVVRVPMKACSKDEVLSLLEGYGAVEYVSKIECTASQRTTGTREGSLISTEGDAYCHVVRFDEGLDALHCFFALNGAVIDPKTHQHLRDEIATMFDQGLGDDDDDDDDDENDEEEVGSDGNDPQPTKKEKEKKKAKRDKKSLEERRRERGELKKDILNTLPLIEAADDTRFIIVTADFFRIAVLPRDVSQCLKPDVACKPRCAMASSSAAPSARAASGSGSGGAGASAGTERMGLPKLCQRLRLRALGLAQQLPVVQSYSAHASRASEDWRLYCRCVAVYAFLHECRDLYEWDACFESLKKCVQTHSAVGANSYYAATSPFVILSDRIEAWRGEGELALRGATKNRAYYLRQRLSFWPLSREAKQFLALLALLVALSVVLYFWVK